MSVNFKWYKDIKVLQNTNIFQLSLLKQNTSPSLFAKDDDFTLFHIISHLIISVPFS